MEGATVSLAVSATHANALTNRDENCRDNRCQYSMSMGNIFFMAVSPDPKLMVHRQISITHCWPATTGLSATKEVVFHLAVSDDTRTFLTHTQCRAVFNFRLLVQLFVG
jgi:hypothetical protein